MYRIIYEKQALKDIPKLEAAKLDKKAKELVEVVREDPLKNPPPYESLVGNLDGYYSRRINIQHRMVYQVYDGIVTEGDVKYDGIVKIIRMWTRYEKM